MRRTWLGLGWVLLGAVTALGVARACAPREDTHHPSPVPSLTDRGGNVVGWVDRGLLDMAERELGGASGQMSEDATDDDEFTNSIEAQRDRLYRTLVYDLGVGERQLSAIRAIVGASKFLGEGNPAVTVHPMTRAECRARRAEVPHPGDDARLCGAVNMVALYDPVREEPSQAKLCIDQYEFPNVPCEYPIVWVSANEAAQICRVLDKRLCDAHEWEGACAGKLGAPGKEYDSWSPRLLAELNHNLSRERVWATGVRPDARLCATGSQKSPACRATTWQECGSNTYPVGAFPRCTSPFGVYDLHGNVAEHMNLPLLESQLGARGGSGETEMKGSWFAFDALHPHEDDCRWRAPAWHATPVASKSSHHNYHLGFRCCKDLE